MAWYLAFFVLLIGGTYAYFDYLLEQSLRERELHVLNTQVDEFRAWYKEGGLPALQERFKAQIKNKTAEESSYFVRIVGPNGDVVFFFYPKGHPTFDYSQLDEQLKPGKTFFVKYHSGRPPWQVVSVPLNPNLYLQIGSNNHSGYKFQNRLRSALLKSILPLLLLGIFMGLFITDRSIRPIKRLITTMRNILKTGNFTTRIQPTHGRQDLDEISSLFNKLLDKNQKLIGELQNTLDHVAHDLRTPMARFRAEAEMALKTPNDSEILQKALQDCMEESEEILSLLAAILKISEAEAGATKLEMQDVSIKETFAKVVDLYEFVAEDRQIELKVDIEKDIKINTDPTIFKQILANLVDNAIKYNKEGGGVTLFCQQRGSEIYIEVADTGKGISEESQDKIWKKMYRQDSSRSLPGLGLGLNIVKAFVDLLNWQIRVESKEGQGTTFTIIVPA